MGKPKFCHYTLIDNARNILSSETFFLSRLDTMNDLIETGLHKNDNKRIFVLSFCNSDALNIPVFYLYGGIDGKGCRIQFTEAKINEIVKHAKLSYVNKQYKRLKKTIPSDDYEITSDWVYYISSDGYCEHKPDKPIKYNGFDDAVSSLRKNNRYLFIKNLIWKYENEYRIVVAFKSDVPYEKIALSFNIKDKEKGISIAYGPETTEDEFVKLCEEFAGYGITAGNKTIESAVSMNLIEKNKKLLK